MVSDSAPRGVVGLAEAIGALRQELLMAWSSGRDARLRFKPAPVELTVEVAVTKVGGAKGKVKWWLVEAGGEASRESVATQTLKLTLDPVAFDAEDTPVEFLVSDPALGRLPDRGEELPLDDRL